MGPQDEGVIQKVGDEIREGESFVKKVGGGILDSILGGSTSLCYLG